MKRSILTAAQIAFLSETFDRNRRLYGGMRMMADDAGDKGADSSSDNGGAADKAGDKPAAEGDSKPDSDKGLGDAGKKALDAERDARKAAEGEVKALKGEFDGFKSALSEALGIKPKDGDKGGDALTAVQEQLAAIQRESAVLRLANEHKITDMKDLELLATAKDADSMKSLAERLAPKEEERDATSRKRPASDRAQGGAAGKGDNSVAAGRELFENRRGAKSTASQ